MVIWKVVNDESAWTAALKEYGSSQHYMQTWGWGEHRSHFGWLPFRCVAHQDDNQSAALVQFLLRRLPGGTAGIVWIPGGPIGKVEFWGGSLLKAVKDITGLKHIVLKMNWLRNYCSEDKLTLEQYGWKRTSRPLSSGLSMLWDISSNDEVRRALTTSNWRHNLKRSNKYELKVECWTTPDAQEIANLYGEMEHLKGLPVQLSKLSASSILGTIGQNLLIVRCLDSTGSIIALRACVILEEQAWDLMAAAGKDARKVYASYKTLWTLVEECSKRGVKTFDLAGIDPEKNKGVWNFKRGTGAQPIEYMGEWETSTSEVLRISVNLAIRIRGTGQ